MSKAKITLSIDKEVLKKIKKLSKKESFIISGKVENFFINLIEKYRGKK